MAPRAKTIRVYEVCVDTEDDYNGNMRTVRFRDEKEANRVASQNTCWGRPAKVTPYDAPRALAQRWGLA